MLPGIDVILTGPKGSLMYYTVLFKCAVNNDVIYDYFSGLL